jgi:hypothetical protein
MGFEPRIFVIRIGDNSCNVTLVPESIEPAFVGTQCYATSFLSYVLPSDSESNFVLFAVPEEKETLLNRQLSRPLGLLSAGSTPRSTPRTTPSRSKSPSIPRKPL